MARPKRDSGQTPAVQRIENAFWEMLAEAPYKDLSIIALSRRAQVNHNTFYYYFDSLDDMAEEMITRNLVPELPAHVLADTESSYDTTSLLADTELQQRFARTCLLVGPHSATWIIDRLEQAVIDLWLQAFGIQRSKIEADDEMQIVFIFGGILHVLGRYGSQGLTSVQSITTGSIGAAARATLTEIINKYRQ